MPDKKLTWWSGSALYLAGLALAILYGALRLTGRIKIIYPKRFPRWRGKLIIAANHPSLCEPFILGGMFGTQYLVSIRKWAPWSTPDKTNFQQRWPWFQKFFGRVMIFVPREQSERREKLRAFREMMIILRAGKILILFPEGGRTDSAASSDEVLISERGHRLRKLKPGVGRLAASTDAVIVPMWVHGAERVLPRGCWFPRFWRRVTIVIGGHIKPRRVRQTPGSLDRIITTTLEKNLLALADETVS